MGYARTLAPEQICRVHIVDAVTGTDRIVHESADVLFEAPNWVGDALILNGDGVLWRLAIDAVTAPVRIEIDVPELNNDHVPSPDGETVYLSANDGHLYAAALTGGPARRITADDGRLHFLHGVSPDGRSLAYVALEPDGDQWWAGVHVRVVDVDGAGDHAVTTGHGPDDGPEYSPDGEWIYLNTERFSTEPGHAQIARVRPDGTGLEQLTVDERVNWFPHLAPEGERAVYLSYPPGVTGHPADLPVQLKLVTGDAWTEATVIAELFGGQGTINVNSWSPDGARFAYVDYPLSATGAAEPTAP